MTMNVEQARFNMVEQQIRTWEVLDPDVLALLFEVRREEFVPAAYRSLAFADLEIPLGPDPGQRMWQPKLEARALQELRLSPGDEVLEIGTGSAYLTALLARQAARVTTVEIDRDLAEAAREKLGAHKVDNVTIEVGDGARGWGGGRYDAIVMTGSTPILPRMVVDQLKPGGRLFAIVGTEPAMHARIVFRASGDETIEKDLFETVVAPLVNALQPERFVF